MVTSLFKTTITLLRESKTCYLPDMRLRVIYTGTVNNYSDTWLALNAAQALDPQVLFMRTARQTDTLGAGEAIH